MKSKFFDSGLNFIIILCIFFMSSGFIPHYIFALIATILIFMKNPRRLLPLEDELLLISFIALAYLNMFSHFDLINTSSQVRSLGVVGVYLSYKIGKELSSQSSMIYVVWLAILESLVIIYYSFINMVHVFQTTKNFISNNFLQVYYHTRSHGLLPSIGASGIAIMVGILFLDIFSKEFKKRTYVVMMGILFLALFLCMSRAAVLGVMCFVACKVLLIFLDYLEEYQKKTKVNLKMCILGLVFLIIVYCLCSYHFVVNQELLTNWSSGRTELLSNVFSFISHHSVFGNGSWGYLDFIYRSPGIHSHNAFLQLYATHGVVALFLLLFIFKKINRRNIIYIIPIFVFNLFNYSMFYSFSFLDIILYYFLNFKMSGELLKDQITE